jgi:hypothetical protein
LTISYGSVSGKFQCKTNIRQKVEVITHTARKSVRADCLQSGVSNATRQIWI